MRLGYGLGSAILVVWIAATAGGCGRGPAQEAAPPLRALAPGDVTLRLQGIAGVMTGAEAPAVPNPPGEGPLFGGQPPHLRFHFDSDSLSPVVDYRQRQLLIYPLDEYRNQFSGVELDSFDVKLERFRATLQAKPERVREQFLVLPVVGSGSVFQTRFRYIYFQDGRGLGVRFITYCERPKYPTIKRGLFYTFQGIIGNRYVSLFWPLTIEDLPEGWSKQRTIDFLQGLTDEEMSPALGRLDQAVETLLIQEPEPSRLPS